MRSTCNPPFSGGKHLQAAKTMLTMLDFPATQRNKDVIAEVLEEHFDPQASLEFLEVASGSGQHVVHFAQTFPHWNFQPTDLEPEHLKSIAAYVEHFHLENVEEPQQLDVARGELWSERSFDAVLAINLIHISPWECTLGLFDLAAKHLKKGGKLYLYGAYKRGGKHIAPSNEQFDHSLRQSNPTWGVRCLDEVTTVATGRGFERSAVVEMPANNLSVIFNRS